MYADFTVYHIVESDFAATVTTKWKPSFRNLVLVRQMITQYSFPYSMIVLHAHSGNKLFDTCARQL